MKKINIYIKLKSKIVNKYKNWSLDTAVRYFPVVNFINYIDPENLCSILEVGCGDTGIAPYINRKIIGLDKYFYSSHAKNIKIIKGDVSNIPFEKDAFDIVISMDMVEHLSLEARKSAINELCRVTNKYLIVGFPSGKKAQMQDQFTFQLTKKIFGKEDHFIDEHIKYDLPTISNFKYVIKNKKIRLIKEIDNFPIVLRYVVLRLLFTKRKFYLRIYFLLNFFAKNISSLNINSSYRKIYIFEKV